MKKLKIGSFVTAVQAGLQDIGCFMWNGIRTYTLLCRMSIIMVAVPKKTEQRK